MPRVHQVGRGGEVDRHQFLFNFPVKARARKGSKRPGCDLITPLLDQMHGKPISCRSYINGRYVCHSNHDQREDTVARACRIKEQKRHINIFDIIFWNPPKNHHFGPSEKSLCVPRFVGENANTGTHIGFFWGGIFGLKGGGVPKGPWVPKRAFLGHEKFVVCSCPNINWRSLFGWVRKTERRAAANWGVTDGGLRCVCHPFSEFCHSTLFLPSFAFDCFGARGPIVCSPRLRAPQAQELP